MNMKSQPIEINKGERLLLVNLNKSFDQSKAEGVYKRSEPLEVGCSKFRYKSDIKSARIQLVKLLTFNTLYCEVVL